MLDPSGDGFGITYVEYRIVVDEAIKQISLRAASRRNLWESESRIWGDIPSMDTLHTQPANLTVA
jgi:hypothetical protein